MSRVLIIETHGHQNVFKQQMNKTILAGFYVNHFLIKRAHSMNIDFTLMNSEENLIYLIFRHGLNLKYSYFQTLNQNGCGTLQQDVTASQLPNAGNLTRLQDLHWNIQSIRQTHELNLRGM